MDVYDSNPTTTVDALDRIGLVGGVDHDIGVQQQALACCSKLMVSNWDQIVNAGNEKHL